MTKGKWSLPLKGATKGNLLIAHNAVDWAYNRTFKEDEPKVFEQNITRN